MTAARTPNYVAYDAFLRMEAASDERHEWVDGVVYAMTDRDGKFEAYEKLPSFREYVLISQDERRVEVRTRDDAGWTSRVGTAGETVSILGQPIAVDAIYG